MEMFTNISTSLNASDSYKTLFERHMLEFWIWSSLYLCLAIIAIIGNGLVLYAALKTRNLGRLRFFDGTIKSLATTDLLIGLIGIPCRIFAIYFTGKDKVLFCMITYLVYTFILIMIT